MWTFLVAQWLRLHVSNAGDAGLIPGRETKIPHAVEQLSPHNATAEPELASRNWSLHATTKTKAAKYINKSL